MTAWSVTDASQLELSQAELDAALHRLPAATRAALEAAADVRRYHERQLMQSWSYVEEDGTRLGQQVTALDRGHLCARRQGGLPLVGADERHPGQGGRRAKSSWSSRPWRRAQRHRAGRRAHCRRGTACSPWAAPRRGGAGLRHANHPGGGQITGPGNAYVAAAKRRVFGVVGIDMVAGPSEIPVICDGQNRPDWIAMDLFSQAEHDEIAQAILLCPDAEFIARVRASIERLLPEMPRQDIIRASLSGRGALIQVADLDEACQIAN